MDAVNATRLSVANYAPVLAAAKIPVNQVAVQPPRYRKLTPQFVEASIDRKC